MTEHSSDMVERVARAFWDAGLSCEERTWKFAHERARAMYRDKAQAALEATHHAKLVEALTLARIYIAAAVQEGRVFGRRDLVAVDKVLAKIGGDA